MGCIFTSWSRLVGITLPTLGVEHYPLGYCNGPRRPLQSSVGRVRLSHIERRARSSHSFRKPQSEVVRHVYPRNVRSMKGSSRPALSSATIALLVEIPLCLILFRRCEAARQVSLQLGRRGCNDNLDVEENRLMLYLLRCKRISSADANTTPAALEAAVTALEALDPSPDPNTPEKHRLNPLLSIN